MSLRHISTAFLGSLRPRRVGFFLLFLAINGCGGGNSPSGPSTSSPRPQSPVTTATAPPAPRTATATASARPTGTTTATTATGSTTAATPPTAENARLPARFVITAHGSINPSSVAAPGGVAIDLTVSSGDGHAHQVVLRTAPPRSLAVPAGGSASIRLTTLKNGRYALIVDGAHAGTLIVGAQPGP